MAHGKAGSAKSNVQNLMSNLQPPMSNLYEPIIGLEVHVELNTNSKMFCSCSADYFGKTPNTHTCPVCLGLLGALPLINKKALESCIKVGLALGCKVSNTSRFERKNYFYPDLPKGYQISQYRWPLCVGGKMEVTDKNGNTNSIRINRVHQEEDTGKMSHIGSVTRIDFNRSGVPLVEIVTEPDFRDTDEIRDYAKKLQQIMRYLGVSNADMEKGDMRLEANISVRTSRSHRTRYDSVGGRSELPPYRVELKNINSFRFMVAAVEYEIKRQTEALEKGERLIQETRGWDENKKQTYVQRVKEEANDYRYFPDPDLPQFDIDNEWVSTLKKELPELPEEKTARFVAQYGIAEPNAKILTDTKEIGDYFEEAARLATEFRINPDKIANILINKRIDRDKILPANLIKILKEETDKPVLSDEELEKAVRDSIKENPKVAEDYKKGKETVLQFLVGQVMAKTKGLADPKKATKKLIDFLQGNR